MKERLISYHFHVNKSIQYMKVIGNQYLSLLHSRKRRAMSEISASNFVVAYVRKQAGIK